MLLIAVSYRRCGNNSQAKLYTVINSLSANHAYLKTLYCNAEHNIAYRQVRPDTSCAVPPSSASELPRVPASAFLRRPAAVRVPRRQLPVTRPVPTSCAYLDVDLERSSSLHADKAMYGTGRSVYLPNTLEQVPSSLPPPLPFSSPPFPSP